MPDTLPAPAPPITFETKEFWEGTTQGKLLLPRCNACQTLIWYPRLFCPNCGSEDIGWQQASGRGTIYSYTVNRRPNENAAYRAEGGAPLVYVLAYVELAEGPRIMTNIVDCDPDTVKVGMPVSVVFHDTGQGSALPRFKPA
ncbi:MAG TPA: Zn-ribbon domain-containing OB-fold protein [Chloroflexota bacterium]|jgi:hypothetical protein|nr:Zn-ribbon domain-containing OB-fold protein [Chloroflexota bacterium]